VLIEDDAPDSRVTLLDSLSRDSAPGFAVIEPARKAVAERSNCAARGSRIAWFLKAT